MPRFDPTQSTLAGVDTATLQKWLADAQQAMATLNTGARVASITYRQGEADRTVSYARADLGQLTQWIRLLQAQLGIVASPRTNLRVVF